jgi:NADH dehydrogenase [ubiquinone] 1 alpha subcomplex assembly factor 7
MADILRTWQRAAPGLLAGATVTLVEASARLKEQQQAALAPFGVQTEWAERLPETGRPMLLAANEFFDALPMRQFLRTPEGWRERLVNWTEERGFHDALGPLVDAEQVPQGDVWEYSPEAMLWAAAIGARLKASGGLALIIDYASRPGETSFRGIARHRRAGPLEQLGQVDLSAGMDFQATATAAAEAGARAYGPTGQGAYLAGLGIQARHDQLAARANEAARQRLTAGLQTLTAPDEMGENFRVLALTGPADPPPAALPPTPLPPAKPGEA